MATVMAPQRRRSWPRVAARGGRRGVAELAALVQVALGAAIVIAAAERRSVLNSANHGRFSAWLAGPLHGLAPGLTRSPEALHRDFRMVLFVMVALWLVVLLGGSGVRPGVVIGAVAALHALFLLCPPLARTDLFNYLGYARLDVLHHANPYVRVPLLNRGDPVFAYSNWHRLRSPYGPLFTVLLLPTARLPLSVAYWLYKSVTVAASLGLLAAVWGCARRLGRPAPAWAVAFAGLNPLYLVYALGGQHNDLVMGAAVMAGALLVAQRREVLGGATLAAALAVKASAGLLAPVIVLAAPRRWRALAGLAGGVFAVAVLIRLGFSSRLPDLGDQDKLVDSYSVPNLIGYAIGRGGADMIVRRDADAVLFAGTAICALAAWRTRRFATPAAAAGVLGVLCVSWLQPWYAVLALPFAALSSSRLMRAVVIVLTAWLVFVWSGAGPTLADQHGIRLAGTPTAQANRRFTDRLLLDRGRRHRHRRANRRPTMGQPRHTGARQSFRHGDRRSRPIPPRGGRRPLGRPVDRPAVPRRGRQPPRRRR